ncbi:Histone lysine acetyltransferase CREBBP [Formica fusca]
MGREFVHTCNNCKSHVETRYHCTVCDDFDLCVSCKDKNGHPHPMKKVRKLSIQRCIQSLVHACQCRDANCHLPSCCKMKRMIMHTKICKRKTNGCCRICKQLITLCCYHTKHCKETKCLVPSCSNIKHKIKQQQLQQRLQQPQLLRRRIAVIAPQMQRPLPVQMPNPGSRLIPMDQSTASRYQTNTVMQQNPNLARQQTPQQLMQQQQPHQAQPGMAMTAQMPRQPGVISGQVGPQASNMHNDAPQQLMQTLRSPLTPEQQNQIRISHPPWLAAFMNQRIVHRQQPGQHGGGVGGPLAPNQPQQQPGLQHMMSQQQQPQHQQQQQQQQGRRQAMLSQQMPVMQQRQQQAAQQQQQQQQQQQLQQRLQQAQLLRRRIAAMNMRPGGPMTRQTVSRLQMSP